MKNNKLAVILTPETVPELERDLLKLTPLLEGIDHEIIAVVSVISSEEYNWMISAPNLNFAEIPVSVKKIKKQKIGACLASDDTKNILFVEEVATLTKAILKKHVEFFIEPLIGAIGDKGKALDEFEHKELLHSTLAKFNLDQETFKEKCCDKDGNINYITPDYFMTSMKVWSLVGGFDLRAEMPFVEYCIRLQALGYTILPF